LENGTLFNASWVVIRKSYQSIDREPDGLVERWLSSALLPAMEIHDLLGKIVVSPGAEVAREGGPAWNQPIARTTGLDVASTFS
jgi:hypothetical protein